MRWLRVRWELSREARRIARVGRLRLPVGLPVLLGAALPLAVPAALYALQDSRIVWTVRPDLERSLVELRGVVERAALAGDSRFAVHFRDAPPEGVRRLVASAGGREVTVRGSGHDRGRFLVEVPPGREPVVLRALVDPTYHPPGGRMREPADARSRLTPELGILRSTTIIPALDLQGGAVEVRFVLPPGWSAVTPWPSDGRGFRIPSTRLEAVEYLGVGPFRRDSVALDGTMVQIAAAGPLGGLGPADVRSVLEMLESLAGPLADTLDARTVLVVPWKFMRGGAAGFASAVHAPSPLLLVHELFHWWNHANVTAGEGAWFREGVTNYFGILVARRLDLATEEETLACLADLAAEMRWLEASRPTSLADASAAYGTDARARRLVYSKGTLFARLLDQPDEEEAAAVGRLARRVFEERRRDRRPLTHARLEMLFDEVLGAPGARLFARHVSGARPLPDPGLPAASGTSGCARFLPPDEARGEESDSRLRRQVSGRP